MSFAAQNNPELDTRSFDKIRKIVYDTAGITLSDEKRSLVSARLSSRMRELKVGSHREYIAHLERDATGEELTVLMDSISTNVTYFFREPAHFGVIRKAYNQWMDEGRRRIRVWCAAASSGEEPYTLTMSFLEERRPDVTVDLKILATDISTRILKRAIAGEYSEDGMNGVSPQLRSRYFDTVGSHKDRRYVAKPEMKKLLLFRYLNLNELPLKLQGPLDLVICRNVMIYFDQDLRRRLVEEFYRILRPGGLLITSHSESLVGIESGFRSVQPSVYLKGDGG